MTPDAAGGTAPAGGVFLLQSSAAPPTLGRVGSSGGVAVWAKILAGVVAGTAAGGAIVHYAAPTRGVPPPDRDAVVWLQVRGPGGVDRRGQPVVLLPVDSVHRAMGSHLVGLAACVGPAPLPGIVHDKLAADAERTAAPGRASE
jgi:hypothetical protein